MPIPVRFVRKQSPYNIGEVAGFQDHEAHRLVSTGIAAYLDPSDEPEEEAPEDPHVQEIHSQLQALNLSREDYVKLLEEAKTYGFANPGEFEPQVLMGLVLEERALAAEAAEKEESDGTEDEDGEE